MFTSQTTSTAGCFPLVNNPQAGLHCNNKRPWDVFTNIPPLVLNISYCKSVNSIRTQSHMLRNLGAMDVRFSKWFKHVQIMNFKSFACLIELMESEDVVKAT